MLHASRIAVVAILASLSTLAFGAGGAVAQTPAPAALKQTVPITGTKGFTGTYTISRFVRRGGATVAVGTVKGRLRGKSVTKRNVAIPATVARQAPATGTPTPGAATSRSARQLLPPTPGACQVLNLVLGPIDLNLLGLRVRTNQINALIEGVPGAGNLVGNLLCSITGLLDPNAITGGQLAQLLNAILALLPRA